MRIINWIRRLARLRIYITFHFEPEEELQPLVYISSPYSLGNKIENIHRQIKVAHLLMDEGLVPLAPLPGSHVMNEMKWRDYEDWMAVDLEHVARCDAVLRLKGESSGADREVAYAQSLGIPVFFAERDEVPADMLNHFRTS